MTMIHVKNMEPVQDWTKEEVKMSLQRYPVGFLLKSGPLDQGFLSVSVYSGCRDEGQPSLPYGILCIRGTL